MHLQQCQVAPPSGPSEDASGPASERRLRNTGRPAFAADLHLMSRVARHDLGAQTTLVHRMEPVVRRVCRSILRGGPDAEDATQVALLGILRSAASYRGESRLEGWCARVAARVAMKDLRRRRSFHTWMIAFDEVLHAREVFAFAEGALLESDACASLRRLPARLRRPLLLRHLFGYSIEEIAALTGASPNTVKDRLRRGAERSRSATRGFDSKVGVFADLEWCSRRALDASPSKKIS